MGRGGVPPVEDMENWWLDQLCSVPDRVLDPLVEEVRAQYSSPRRKGLAELLDIEGDVEKEGEQPMGSEQRRVDVKSYVEAAEISRSQSGYPVILPA